MCAGTLCTLVSVCVCAMCMYYFMAHGNYRCRYNKLPLNLLFVVLNDVVVVVVIAVVVIVVVVVLCSLFLSLVSDEIEKERERERDRERERERGEIGSGSQDNSMPGGSCSGCCCCWQLACSVTDKLY